MKRVSKFEIISKRDSKTGIMEVSMYADKVKIYISYIAEGDYISHDYMMNAPILLENGLSILTLPKLGNIPRR